ncbi:TorF family putative porin [Aestuariivita sp.]|jgi:uncharacterized protein (TIGR02001 family)|uniref:TorF family putative porin n=1 Tax=Aestuariivita sp. TaxID=1872407 RepID=UPI00216EBD58|nr:TorF family putative porin [Aestuariivita sp.]MCE8007787.1 hypothetical protein [Aestuariivita sp.]
MQKIQGAKTRTSRTATGVKPLLATLGALAVILGSPAQQAQANEVSFGYGVDITSNYISKGSTQTGDRPAIQPYVELYYGLFYAGVWASNVRFDGVTDLEVDLYAGITPSWGAVDFDIGFAQYFYRDDSTDYGEAYVKADLAVTDRLSLGLDYYREVYFDENWVYLNAAYSGLPGDLTISGGFGSDLGSRNLASDKNVFDIGLSRDLTDHSAIDVRAYGGNLDEEVVVLTLSFFN